jgi:retinol dehydrogenase-12
MSTPSQLFPPCPTFTEDSLVDLPNKVYLVTGSTSGVGLALSKILYTLHATVYIGARSSQKYHDTAAALRKACPDSKGALKPFIADMADLSSIKPAVEKFLKEEGRLDVLFLNAGVMVPPAGSTSKDVRTLPSLYHIHIDIQLTSLQSHDLELAVHCLAPFLITTLLTSLLTRTASQYCHANASTRVIWVSSLLNLSTPAGGVNFDASTKAPKQLKGMENYMQSKAGVYFLAYQFAARQKSTTMPIANTPKTQEVDHTIHTPSNTNPEGIQHIALNPGFTSTSLQRGMPAPIRAVMSTVFKGPEYGAYTELYAGLGPDVRSGDFIIPWGRKGSVPAHIVEGTVAKEGTTKSISARFYEWCEVQVRDFM